MILALKLKYFNSCFMKPPMTESQDPDDRDAAGTVKVVGSLDADNDLSDHREDDDVCVISSMPAVAGAAALVHAGASRPLACTEHGELVPCED